MQPLLSGQRIVAELGFFSLFFFFFFEIPPKYISLFYGLIVYRATS